MMASLWTDLMVPGVSIAEKIARPIIVYAFLVIGLRLAGKRELAQLNPFDLVVLLTLSNTVQNAIIGNDNSLLGGLIGAATLLVVNWLLVRWTYHHPSVERLVEGTPTVLIEDGALDQQHLARELVTVDELRSAAHHQGLLSLEDVERAVLESDGTLTFVPRPDATRVRRHAEILGRLDALQADIAALRSSPPAAAGIPAAGRESPPEP
jgi:uncharacterized membrane protein YcaP (DUF421 family)